jgi:hypothetical protein
VTSAGALSGPISDPGEIPMSQFFSLRCGTYLSAQGSEPLDVKGFFDAMDGLPTLLDAEL